MHRSLGGTDDRLLSSVNRPLTANPPQAGASSAGQVTTKWILKFVERKFREIPLHGQHPVEAKARVEFALNRRGLP